MQIGQKEMIKASAKLTSLVSFENGFPIYFLTGKNFLYQTLFCIKSLTSCSSTRFKFILIDDGTFDDDLIESTQNQISGVKIILKETIDQNLVLKLPRSKFPYLHLKREVYPHIKKLTDIHTIDEHPFKLVLDSDMLFWNEPTQMISWLTNTEGSLHMVDCEESYGYDKSAMKSLCRHEIPELINVGAIGIESSTINWQEVETWSKTLENNYGKSYFLEQALSAMIIAGQKRTVLKKEEYKVNPSTINDNSTLHHYVDLSKKIYFEEAWRKHLDQ